MPSCLFNVSPNDPFSIKLFTCTYDASLFVYYLENNSWARGDMEINSKCSTRYLTREPANERDLELNTRREIPYLQATIKRLQTSILHSLAAIYYFFIIFISITGLY